MFSKTPKKIMAAAKNELCTVGFPSVCRARSDTTVFAHHNDGTGGSNRLTGPLTGGFACHECHQMLDGKVPMPEWIREDLEFYKRRSMTRTINRLIELGLVTVAGL